MMLVIFTVALQQVLPEYEESVYVQVQRQHLSVDNVTVHVSVDVVYVLCNQHPAVSKYVYLQ